MCAAPLPLTQTATRNEGKGRSIIVAIWIYFITSHSLDFVVNGLFTKLFKTSNIDTVNYCRTEFQFDLLCIVLEQRRIGNFLRNIVHVTMSIVNVLIVFNCVIVAFLFLIVFLASIIL